MKKLRIYIDTSVIGGCFDQEFSRWSNGLVKDFRLGNLKPVISEIVAVEISRAPQEVKEKYLEIIKMGAEELIANDEVDALAEAYEGNKILTSRFMEDMIHIALATVANVDVLASWNFKHIVHFDKIIQFNAINIKMGYKKIEIYSPREVTNYEEE